MPSGAAASYRPAAKVSAVSLGAGGGAEVGHWPSDTVAMIKGLQFQRIRVRHGRGGTAGAELRTHLLKHEQEAERAGRADAAVSSESPPQRQASSSKVHLLNLRRQQHLGRMGDHRC